LNDEHRRDQSQGSYQSERRFFAIQRKAEKPDRYIEMPEKAYA
jgi:hypothetical protein